LSHRGLSDLLLRRLRLRLLLREASLLQRSVKLVQKVLLLLIGLLLRLLLEEAVNPMQKLLELLVALLLLLRGLFLLLWS